MKTHPPKELVHRLLENYDLKVTRIHSFRYCNEHTYRIFSNDGKSYRMRIREHEDGAHREMRSHMELLCLLNEKADLKVPKPVRMKNGSFIKRIRVPENPKMYHCSIVSWMPGYVLGKRENPRGYLKLGESVARFHQHSEDMSSELKLEIPIENGCCAGDRKKFAKKLKPLFENIKGEQREVFEAASCQTLRALSEMRGPVKERKIIHGDLHSWNASLYRGRAHIFDFEAIKWGHFIQDIALWKFREYYQDWLNGWNDDIHNPEALEYNQAFKEGYTDHRTWPGENHALLNGLAMQYVFEYAILSDPAERQHEMKKTEVALKHLMKD